jgi:hypothetical protein
LTVYRPVKEKDTRVAMVICPGGGYHALYWDGFGKEFSRSRSDMLDFAHFRW